MGQGDMEGQMVEVNLGKGQGQGMEMVIEMEGVKVVIGHMVGVKDKVVQGQMEGDHIQRDKIVEVKAMKGQMEGVKVKALIDRMGEVKVEDRLVEGGMTLNNREGVTMNE